MMASNVERMPLRCGACCPQSNTRTDENGRSVLFEDEDRLTAHIAVEHVEWTPFECILCPMVRLPTETVLKFHYDQAHPGILPKAIYTYREGKRFEMKRILAVSKLSQTGTNVTNQNTDIGVAQLLQPYAPPAHRPVLPNESVNNHPISFEVGRSNSAHSSEIPSVTTEVSDDMQIHPAVPSVAIAVASADDTVVIQEPIEVEREAEDTEDIQMEEVTPIEQTAQRILTDIRKETDSKATKSRKRKLPSSTGGPNSCRLCGHELISASESQRTEHIWRRHMPRAPHQCRTCRWQLFTSRNLIEAQHCHINDAHPELAGGPLENNFKDYREKLNGRFQKKLKLAFAAAEPPTDDGVVISSETEEPIEEITAKPSAAKRMKKETNKAKIVRKLTSVGRGKKPAAIRVTKFSVNQSKRVRNDVVTPAKDPIIRCHHCSQMISVKTRSAHIWMHHMEQKRFQCNLCPYQIARLDLVKQHALRQHPGETGASWKDVKSELQTDYQQTYDSAFSADGAANAVVQPQSVSTVDSEEPTEVRGAIECEKTNDTIILPEDSKPFLVACSTPSNGEVGEFETSDAATRADSRRSLTADGERSQQDLRCLLCDQTMSRSVKARHIWMKHMSKLRFECTECDYRNALQGVAKKHLLTKHKYVNADDGEVLVDLREELSAEFEEKYQNAFGSTPQLNGTK